MGLIKDIKDFFDVIKTDSNDSCNAGISEKREVIESKRLDVMSLERDIIIALRQVYDPEIPVNIYDLGLIYELKVDEDHNVYIQMTLTAPNCPMADYVVEQVKTAVEDVPGVVSVQIDLVFEPVWDKSRMSEEALVELGMDGD